MASHTSITLPWLLSISQKPGKAATAVTSEPQKYTRVRPMRSDSRPK